MLGPPKGLLRRRLWVQTPTHKVFEGFWKTRLGQPKCTVLHRFFRSWPFQGVFFRVTFFPGWSCLPPFGWYGKVTRKNLVIGLQMYIHLKKLVTEMSPRLCKETACFFKCRKRITFYYRSGSTTKKQKIFLWFLDIFSEKWKSWEHVIEENWTWVWETLFQSNPPSIPPCHSYWHDGLSRSILGRFPGNKKQLPSLKLT